MIKAIIEIDNGAHVVLLQDEEGNKMVTSVIPLVYMINSGKEIEVEGDNVMAGKIKDYIINLKENIDILEYIKEMVGDEPENILPVNFINGKSVHDEVVTSSEGKLTLDRELWYDVDGNFTYFYKKMVTSPSPDVMARMNEAVDITLLVKTSKWMLRYYLKCDYMTYSDSRKMYYFFDKEGTVLANCNSDDYDYMTISVVPASWVTGIDYPVDDELSLVTLKNNDGFLFLCWRKVYNGDYFKEGKADAVKVPVYKFKSVKTFSESIFYLIVIPGGVIEGGELSVVIQDLFTQLEKLNDVKQLVTFYDNKTTPSTMDNECVLTFKIDRYESESIR